jgi:hypothetical protein
VETRKELKIFTVLTPVSEYKVNMYRLFKKIGTVFSERLAILCITVLLSFISLAKTGYNVNLPDPDKRRKSPQFRENVKRFWLTSLPFQFICALFRVSCLAYFCATLSYWTTLITLAIIALNMAIFNFGAKSSPAMTVLLGTVSVFMPNGYLLYNFAATFLVDFTFGQTQKCLFWHMICVTIANISIIALIWIGQVLQWSEIIKNIPANSVLSSDDVKYGINAGLIFLGGTSALLALIHWKKSIVVLYAQPDNQNQEPECDVEEEEQL